MVNVTCKRSIRAQQQIFIRSDGELPEHHPFNQTHISFACRTLVKNVKTCDCSLLKLTSGFSKELKKKHRMNDSHVWGAWTTYLNNSLIQYLPTSYSPIKKIARHRLETTVRPPSF